MIVKEESGQNPTFINLRTQGFCHFNDLSTVPHLVTRFQDFLFSFFFFFTKVPLINSVNNILVKAVSTTYQPQWSSPYHSSRWENLSHCHPSTSCTGTVSLIYWWREGRQTQPRQTQPFWSSVWQFIKHFIHVHTLKLNPSIAGNVH